MAGRAEDKTLGELVRELIEASVLYVKQQLSDITQRVLIAPTKKAGKAWGLFAGGGAAVWAAVVFLALGAVWGLGEALGGRYWASLLICGGALLIVGAVLLLIGWRIVDGGSKKSDEEEEEGAGEGEGS